MLRKLLISCAALSIAFAANAATDTTTPTTAPTAVVEKAPVEKTVAKDAVVEKVNVNTAKAKDLIKAGVDKHIAHAIVKYRKKHGNFKSLNDLLDVPCGHKQDHTTQKWLDQVEGNLTI